MLPLALPHMLTFTLMLENTRDVCRYVSGGDFSGLPSGVRPSAISTIAGESDMLVITSYDRTVGSTVTYPIYFYKPSTDTVRGASLAACSSCV